MRKLSLTLLAALIPLVAASLALGSYLNYAGVRHNYLELVGARMSTVARRMANDAEVAMSLGVPLASQDVMNTALEREAEADPMILSVDVVADGGRVLFSSDPARRDTAEPAADPAAIRHEVPIASAFGTREGAAVVRTSNAAVEGALGDMGRSILWLSLAATLLGILVVAGAVAMSVRALWQRLTARGPTVSGAMVPEETRAAFASIDAEHSAIALRLGQKRGAATSGRGA
ncbi:hypothetical protein ATO13_14645 [Stappia sp. 22II-S9-Z10]|nr:hypothetical protein ATO13_14645 [Stappia sp. 22II-S9-Z10]